MKDIIISIVGSIVGAYFLSAFNLLKRIFPFQYNTGFYAEYKNQKQALRSIKRYAKKSKSIRVLALKGSTFSSPGEDALHSLLENGPVTQKYLISHPDNPYVGQRANELELSVESLKRGLKNSIKCFEEAKGINANIELRLHNEAVRTRLIIFDDCLYMSFQPPGSSGRESPMQLYKKTSFGYKAMEMLFEDLWEKYKCESIEEKYSKDRNNAMKEMQKLT